MDVDLPPRLKGIYDNERHNFLFTVCQDSAPTSACLFLVPEARFSSSEVIRFSDGIDVVCLHPPFRIGAFLN